MGMALPKWSVTLILARFSKVGMSSLILATSDICKHNTHRVISVFTGQLSTAAAASKQSWLVPSSSDFLHLSIYIYPKHCRCLQARNYLIQRVYFLSRGAQIGLQFDHPLAGQCGLFTLLYFWLTKALYGFLKDYVCFFNELLLDSF